MNITFCKETRQIWRAMRGTRIYDSARIIPVLERKPVRLRATELSHHESPPASLAATKQRPITGLVGTIDMRDPGYQP